MQWSYSFNRLVRELPSEILGPFVFAVNRSILTGALVGDYRDNVVSPRRGLFWNTTLQAAPEALGSETPFIKFYGQLFAFVPLGEDTVWASGFRLGATAFDQVLIEEDRFKAGGSASVRGFAQETLGPRSPEGIPVGGGGLLVLNQEVRFPIYRWLRGAGFYDAGNVFPTTSDISFADLRHNVGAGLRLEVPFGVFRFDVARVLSPRPDEDPWRFIFTLGNVF